MALLVLAALVGLLGSGPLSKAIRGAEGGPLWVEYARFARHRAPTELRVHVGPGLASEGQLRLQFDQPFTEWVQIQRVDPQPEQEEVGDARIIHQFSIGDTQQPVVVVYQYEPHDFGRLPISIQVEGGPAVQLPLHLPLGICQRRVPERER